MTTTAPSRSRKLLLGEDNNKVVQLIIVNLVVFMLLKLIQVIYFLEGFQGDDFERMFLQWTSLPASLGRLLTRPWTLLTYMFTHIAVWHVLSNMLWLWWFGYILQDLAGPRHVLPLYLYGGMAGAAFYLLAYNLFPVFRASLPYADIIGASASVMAIAIGTTLIAPDFRVFPMILGGIPLWVITGIYLLIDVAGIYGSNAGGHIAHLGGGLMGFLFVRQLKRGNDWGESFHRSWEWMGHLFDPNKKHKKRAISTRQRIFYKQEKAPYRKIGSVSELKVNEVLDKINRSGFDSLTPEEKEILLRASQQEDQ